MILPSISRSQAVLASLLLLASLSLAPAQSQPTSPAAMTPVKSNIPYAEPANPRQMLDIYAPPDAKGKGLPVVVWIHGGGWASGDKTSIQSKPPAFVSQGMVFVSVSHRFVTQVPMASIVQDIAKSIRWVHDHIAEEGGDPNRLLVMGHSSGAQLAAIVCTDERHLKAEGLSFAIIKGCVPVDGDTYDIPLQIATATARRQAQGKPEPKFGHREKFGDEVKQRDFSAVTHVAKGRGIPPFFILHVAAHEDTTAQAKRLHTTLTEAGIPSTILGADNTDHSKVNASLGLPGDAPTKALFEFVTTCLKK